MEKLRIIVIYCSICIVMFMMLGYLFWQHIWFFRNPSRQVPPGDGIVSPADGTVVYVKNVDPDEDVIVIKQDVRACINDIVREDLVQRRILIGIFMSPFDVHYNRAPLSGKIECIKHHPAKTENVNMGSMHLRTLLGHQPHYEDSLHIVQNERTVTKLQGAFKGEALSCYIIQIAGWSVNGIDSFFKEGMRVEKGAIFGIIRIGSQVDMVVPWREGMSVNVKPGDRVRAGETVIIE